jgi:hypothetical protein
MSNPKHSISVAVAKRGEYFKRGPIILDDPYVLPTGYSYALDLSSFGIDALCHIFVIKTDVERDLEDKL